MVKEEISQQEELKNITDEDLLMQIRAQSYYFFLIYANKIDVLSIFAFFPCLYEINVVSLHDFFEWSVLWECQRR